MLNALSMHSPLIKKERKIKVMFRDVTVPSPIRYASASRPLTSGARHTTIADSFPMTSPARHTTPDSTTSGKVLKTSKRRLKDVLLQIKTFRPKMDIN